MEDVAAGVLSFSKGGDGHKMATACVNELRWNFRGYDWGYNGPGVITRVLQHFCATVNVCRHLLIPKIKKYSKVLIILGLCRLSAMSTLNK